MHPTASLVDLNGYYRRFRGQGDTRPFIERTLSSEGLDVIDIGSVDGFPSPLVNLCLKIIHIDAYVYKLCNILYIFFIEISCTFVKFFNFIVKFDKIQH
jgi:hypothetical protein